MQPYFTIDPGNRGAQAQKAAWRDMLGHRRQVIPADLKNTTDWKVANNLRKLLAELPASMVGLYLPQEGEVNLLPLVPDLRRAGYGIALPRVSYAGHGFTFNVWPEDERGYDTDDLSRPVANGAEVLPAVIVAPMLGYTRQGYRLGRGGGYYDRTFKSLPYPVITVGVCHTELEVTNFPKEYADWRLDYVVTGKEVILCR